MMCMVRLNSVLSNLTEFLIFGLKQARAAVFAGSFFVLLFASNHIPLFGFARYDFLFIAAVLIQAVLYFTHMETKDEVKVICLFHTNHFVYDFRVFLIITVFVLFWKARVYFTVTDTRRWMPLNLSFLLIAFFIWVAENISTYLGAWKYPDQIHEWTLVSTQKVTSWFLMVIISFILVAYLKHFKKDAVTKTVTKRT